MGNTVQVESGELHEIRATLHGVMMHIEDSDKRRDENRMKLIKWGAPLLATLLGGSGYGVKLMADEPAEIVERNADEVMATVVAERDKNLERLDKVEDKVERLGRAHVETELRQYEQIEWIADKIDKAHPKASVEKPDSLKEYEQRIEKKRKDQAVKDLLGE